MEFQTATILLVDDDDVDRRAIVRAFKKQHILSEICEAKDGKEALSILKGTDGLGPLKKPYIVLLDLNMPGMDGHEFLEVVRDDDEIKDTIVFVLTTSNDERDKARAYEKQVAGYLLKHTPGRDFMKMIEMLELFINSVEFPQC